MCITAKVQCLETCDLDVLFILQTPVWEESDVEDNLGPRHKRSNSLGSGDQKIKEVCIFFTFIIADSGLRKIRQ